MVIGEANGKPSTFTIKKICYPDRLYGRPVLGPMNKARD